MNDVMLHCGVVGATDDTEHNSYASAAKAMLEATKLLEKKRKEGYQLVLTWEAASTKEVLQPRPGTGYQPLYPTNAVAVAVNNKSTNDDDADEDAEEGEEEEAAPTSRKRKAKAVEPVDDDDDDWLENDIAPKKKATKTAAKAEKDAGAAAVKAVGAGSNGGSGVTLKRYLECLMNAEGDWKRVRFMIFDAPEVKGGVMKRLDAIRTAFAARQPAYGVLHEHEVCTSMEHLLEKLAYYESMGGEGIMLRSATAAHRGGRTSDLLKVGTVITFKYFEFTNDGVPRSPTFMRVRPDVSPDEFKKNNLRRNN